jgi:hypothetical protein
VGWKVKAEAFFHLTSCTCYIYIVLLTLMLFPALYLRLTVFPNSTFSRTLFDMSLFLLATCSASAFYLASQREIFHHWHDKIKYLPFLMALGIGISVSNTLAALEGFFGKCGEFVRTPKFGVETSQDENWKKKMGSLNLKKSFVPFLELFLGLYMVGCLLMCLYFGTAPMSIPFLVLFAVGYFYVSFSSFHLHYQTNQKIKEAQKALAFEPLSVETVTTAANTSTSPIVAPVAEQSRTTVHREQR